MPRTAMKVNDSLLMCKSGTLRKRLPLSYAAPRSRCSCSRLLTFSEKADVR